MSASMSNPLENAVLLLLLNNDNIANLGDATGVRGSTTAGSVYVALHTADVAEGSAQNSNEATYTGYGRVAVARSASGWTVTGKTGVNAADVTFGQCTSGLPAPTVQVMSHWSVGFASSGASTVMWSGPIASDPHVFTATSADTLTVPGHALSVNDQVVAYPTQGSTLPTGLTEGTVYYVKTASGNDITLSATLGGSTLDLSAAGAGVILKASPLAVGNGITPKFDAGTINIVQD